MTKRKKLFFAFLALLLLGTVVSLVPVGITYGYDKIFLVLVSFHLVVYVYLLLFFALYFSLTRILWYILPQTVKEEWKGRRTRLKNVILLSLTIAILGVWGALHFLFNYRFSPAAVMGILGILLAALFLAAWMMGSRRWKKGFLICSISMISLSLLLSVVKIETIQPDNHQKKEKLGALPYVHWVPAEDTIDLLGVVRHDPERSYPGLNLYHSPHKAESYLLDMDGRVVHSWKVDLGKENDYEWSHMEMHPGGDALGYYKDNYLVRMDWQANIKWASRIQIHHDLDLHDNGDIYTLSRNFEAYFFSLTPLPVRHERIVIVSQDGHIKKTHSLIRILQNKLNPSQINQLRWWMINPRWFAFRIKRSITPPRDFLDNPSDILHTNSIEIINRDVNPVFKKDRLLIGVRHIDLVGVVDLEEERLVWSWGQGELKMPHHPTLLENGNILIYDNGNFRGYSRVIELNPMTEKIVWEYTADPLESFYSKWGGASQRLPNGNTLITDTEKGRVFEVTRQGDIVWEFLNPEIDLAEKTRGAIYRMSRLHDDERYPFLKRFHVGKTAQKKP